MCPISKLCTRLHRNPLIINFGETSVKLDTNRVLGSRTQLNVLKPFLIAQLQPKGNHCAKIHGRDKNSYGLSFLRNSDECVSEWY